MRILSISAGIENDEVENIMYYESESVLDYEVVIWDPDDLLVGYDRTIGNDGKYMGYPCLNDDGSVKILEDIVRRKSEMLELINLGRTLVIFTPPPSKFYVATGERTYSGTGRNRQTTRHVQSINLLSVLPFEKIDTVEAVGTNLEFRGTEMFKPFWDKIKNYVYYRAYFRTPVGVPLFFIKGTDKAVGSYLQLGKGHVLFLPALNLPEELEEYEEVERSFLEAISELVKLLQMATGDFVLPEWSNRFVLSQEKKEREALSSLEKQLSETLTAISQQKEVLLRIEENKLLFTGSGRALEVQVRNAFLTLGFTVTEGLPNRDDLILEHNGRFAVVEVKGVSKSAAEKHAAQLEKWVSEYISARGSSPKGILVVNTFKDTPLDERIEEDFPHQMMGYSERRDHCLITGVQLLGMLLDAQDNPAKVTDLVNKIFTTTGKFSGYEDWKSFLLDMRVKDEGQDENG